MRRDFGVFGNADAIHDPNEYTAWTVQFKALANAAAKQIDSVLKDVNEGF